MQANTRGHSSCSSIFGQLYQTISTTWFDNALLGRSRSQSFYIAEQTGIEATYTLLSQIRTARAYQYGYWVASSEDKAHHDLMGL